MRLNLSLLVLSLVLLSSQSGFAARSYARIVGGTAATAGEMPFMVSMQRSGRHFCGGSLIDKSWVLTAAHCVKGASASSIKVKVGLLKMVDTAGVETFSLDKIVSHPENSSSNNDYDFALLKLSGESKYTPVSLNSDYRWLSDQEQEGPMATTAGWGTTSEGGSLSPVLLKVEVPMVSTKRCEEAYPGQILKSMLCAGFEKGGKDSCQGDSGGPLLSRSFSGELALTGVVSWGEGCARPKKFGVYADVISALSWIENQMGASK